MSDTLQSDPIRSMPHIQERPDALSVIPGVGMGTEAPAQTFPTPGQNFLQNLFLALEEGLTIPPSTFGINTGMPERVWDPRLLGALTGTIAILEPGPGGEAKVLGKAGKEGGEKVIGKAVKLNDGRILSGPNSHQDIIDEFLLPPSNQIPRGLEYRHELIPMKESSKTFGFMTDAGRYVTPEEAGTMVVGRWDPKALQSMIPDSGDWLSR